MSNTHNGRVRIELTPEEVKALLTTCLENLKEKQGPEEVDPSVVSAYVKLSRGLDRLKPPELSGER